MGPETIAALVRASAPDHAGHKQEFKEYDGIDRQIGLMCSCGVGLTIPVPPTEQPSTVRDPGALEGHGVIKVRPKGGA